MMIAEPCPTCGGSGYHRRRWTEDKAREAHGAYARGATLSQLAREYESNITSVAKAFRRFGLPTRARGKARRIK